MEGTPKQFSSPEEEIAYLRAQIATQERQVKAIDSEVSKPDFETIAKEQLKTYSTFTPKTILDPSYQLSEHQRFTQAEQASTSHFPVEDILQLAEEKGIKNALSVLEKIDNAYIIDEVHRHLIERIREGTPLAGLKEDIPPWQVMHLTLFEITLPELKSSNDHEYQLAELVGMMEQLFAGLRTIGSKVKHNHFALEIAVADNSDDIVFYVAVPVQFISLFEKLTLSLFPNAVLTQQLHDYNIFINKGKNIVADITLKKHPIYPIKTHTDFVSDPLAVILNAFSKIERTGGGAAIQFIIRYPQSDYYRNYHDIISRVEKGMKISDSISRSTISGELLAGLGEFFSNQKKTVTEEKTPTVDQSALEQFREKIQATIFEVNIRIVVSAQEVKRTKQIFEEITATLNQFDKAGGNSFVIKSYSGRALKLAEKAFSFREFNPKKTLPLSLTELSTLVHFPGNGINSSPQFKQSYANTAPAPTEIPTEGTLLGINKHRNIERPIYSSEKDRMRHFYVIGQTGTGKSVFLKNLILQDINAGSGVCMIDPHGTDIEDVLGAIPSHRHADIIYFDPAQLEYPIGLNMLEYDPARPEQKTFVVNELFSIFQKLYGANPESMGPMFEQYFRNATLLVMDDPASGSTLMDISRVMADPKYRRMKLERATNPVVVQFWREIATKAGGEASLENIVPYIVSKFDIFTANDYMRPIIGQQKSAFNFRQVMDEKKILLVNLSKGRLGDINANLIGMIIIGKILMAALSRVDDPAQSFPPFYLHIDEFQNFSTPAIASILSEARKYKLALTMAHQFIAQLDENIKEAVFGNVGSVATFRVGSEDADFLEQQFAPIFTANDLMNIPNYTALVRILANGIPTKPFSIATLPPVETNPLLVPELIKQSLLRYGRPRAEVEAEIANRYVKSSPTVPDLSAII